MSKTFGDLIQDKVEIYVDNIVVKTREGSTIVEDLTLVFGKLEATRTKLNLEKCIFGVSIGKLLGFLVSYRGIEANPEKIKAIEVMRPPARIKDIQKLTWSLATLSHFISRLAERALPFFKLLWKSSPFAWTEEAEQAFKELKQHLASLPILVAPEPGEPLYLYIAAATEAISMVLVAERAAQEGQEPGNLGPATETRTVQKPVYYVSEVLHEAKARYLETHKLLYAILVASRKLHHYFQAHKVVVMTSFPLRAILYNPNAIGNIAKWAAELAEFQLDFQPRHTIKSQVLADFIVEWTPPPCAPRARTSLRTPHLRSAGVRSSPSPTRRFSSTDPPASRVPAREWSSLTQAETSCSMWCVSNSRPPPTWREYEALIFGLSAALSLGVRQLLVKGDSQLIIKQVCGECSCNEPRLTAYLLHVRKLEKDFTALELQHVPRADNSAADDLSQRASTRAPVLEGVFERWLLRPAAQPVELGEGGETGTSKPAVPVVSQNPPKAVCALGNSADPLVPQSTTQSGPDA
jgi:hypothetical protein